MTQKSLKWRVPLIAAIVAISFFYAYPPFDPDGSGPKEGKIKLGLDLQGGMHLVLRVDASKLDEKAREDATPRAMEIIRNRIDQFGVSEPSIQRQGVDQIVVQLPGITDRDRALALIGKTALLEFKLVSDDSALLKQALDGKVPQGFRLHKDEDGQSVLLEEATLLTGQHIVDAGVNFESQFNEPVVTLQFDGEGAKIFSDVTGSNVNRRLAIVLDDKVQSAPVINERIPSGNAQITGRFSVDQANDLAIALRAGALPAPIVVEEERTVGATLGKDSVAQGLRAALVGFAFVIAFMAVYYLFAGLVADLALMLNLLITLGFLSYFGATLTLPGIAGLILTIGMAVDTNVLVFERIREEQALKKPVVASILAGYKKAFVTILDANLTTLITAGILYYIGSGPIRGFALTLAIGISASMFTGIFVTRTVFDLLSAKGGLGSLKMLQFLARPPRIDYLKTRKICYAISIAAILAGAWSFVSRGPTMFGVDFAGGTLQEYRFRSEAPIEKVRESLARVGEGTAVIQRVGQSNDILVRSSLHSEKKVGEQLKKDFGQDAYEILRIESVGPVVGKELKRKAVWAFLLALAGIWIYVVYRFDFRFAFGAILAIFHDGLIALGAVALTGRELSVTVLAAILTILGYSVNDTIVIFDRIRERRRAGIKETFAESINNSVNLMMSRTILTSLTVFFAVIPLWLLGGEVINDFAFTMFVGLASGIYSTVYIAAPVLVDWIGSKK